MKFLFPVKSFLSPYQIYVPGRRDSFFKKIIFASSQSVIYSSLFAWRRGIPSSMSSKKWHHFTLIQRLRTSVESVRVTIRMRVNVHGQRMTHICSGFLHWMSEYSISGKVSKSFHDSIVFFSKSSHHSMRESVMFLWIGLMKRIGMICFLVSSIGKCFEYMWNFDICRSIDICYSTSNSEDSIEHSCR